MLPSLILIIHVLVCTALILIVLLQSGKGAQMGAAFGGGSSQTLFGSTGASTFLSKATTVAAIVFMLTSLALAYLSSDRTGSSIVTDTEVPVQQQTAPPSPEKSPTSQPEGAQPPSTQ